MQYSTVVLALAAAVAAQQGSCPSDYASKFAISVVKPQGSAKRDLNKRAACGTGDKSLTIELKGGILKDQDGRTGYIASNAQFQFDAPPQADHLETSGFQVCGNNSLALNGNAVWYQCLSGDFYNLYNKNWAPQCSPVEIMAVACDGTTGGSTGGSSSSAAPSPAPSAASASPAAPAPSASQISDGQPQAPSAAPAPTIATGAAAQYGPQILLAAAGFAGAALL